MRRLVAGAFALGLLSVVLTGCGESSAQGAGGPGGGPALNVGAIPDQDPQELQRIYGGFADYLRGALGVEVRYVPVTDYTASVTAFRRGDLDLVFFGGLTGVQARLQVPGAVPIAQRDIDAQFRSVFIAGTGTGITSVAEVAGLRALGGRSFTFGSESSTSGRLMPQYFLSQAGLGLDAFKGQVGYSGSHDTTAKLVEAGTYEAGALNASVWDARTKDGNIDTTKVREIFRTPPYHDYHWLLRPDVDQRLGAGFTQRLTDALVGLDGSDDRERQILDLFHADKFIATSVENYAQIETVARAAGLIK